jgi:hypothetical protein
MRKKKEKKKRSQEFLIIPSASLDLSLANDAEQPEGGELEDNNKKIKRNYTHTKVLRKEIRWIALWMIAVSSETISFFLPAATTLCQCEWRRDGDFWLRLRLPFELCRANQMDRIDTHTHTRNYLDCTRAHSSAPPGTFPHLIYRLANFIPTRSFILFYFIFYFFAGISYRLKVRALYYTHSLSLAVQ